ncbi:heparinase II/III family protein [Paenibacillus tritici]|uniref:Heparinase II/III family protein n=1 Tax=Paenibacillus tritici TaxID=1873425 RepID=A0ABX2DMS1_9BACL|nr:heparinase II/III family protein [Paenibacillus tritici]NQX45136.1 heparinase II/III family protein [Paenibacillus tritici]
MNQLELAAIIQDMIPADLSLYYPQGDSEAFWTQALSSEILQADLAEIRAEAQRLDGQPIPQLTYTLFTLYGRTGSRLEYERPYFERRRRLNTYVFLSLLEPENTEHLEKLADVLWAICDEYTWCVPAHLPAEHDASEINRHIDLFSSETGFALSEISLLLGERLPPLLRSRIRSELERRIFQPFLEHGPYFWETSTHNWAAVCAGSIGAAALLLVKDPARLTDILLKTESSMNYYLQGFGEDGACQEGLGYWNYGFGYFTYYSDLLRARSGGRLDWFKQEKVAQIARFQQQCFIDGSYVANFSDSVPQVRVHRGLSHYLAEVYTGVLRPPSALRAPFTEDHCSRFAPALRNLIWTRAGKENITWEAGSSYLPDAAWLVSRHVSTAGAFGFAAKGGHNDEPHNHNDLGQFILSGRGEIFAADLGSGEYTADYFGAGRYGYDCNGSQGHSVPVIDGQYQGAGRGFCSKVLHAAAAPDKDELMLELARAYPVAGLQSLVRSLVWHKEELPRLELTDTYRYAGTPAGWTERFVTWRRPELAEPGNVLLPGADGSGVLVAYNPQIVQPEITVHAYKDHFGRETQWHSLDFHALQPGAVGVLAFTFQFI